MKKIILIMVLTLSSLSMARTDGSLNVKPESLNIFNDPNIFGQPNTVGSLINDYVICMDKKLNDLVLCANNALDAGFEVEGGIVVHRDNAKTTYYQTLVRR